MNKIIGITNSQIPLITGGFKLQTSYGLTSWVITSNARISQFQHSYGHWNAVIQINLEHDAITITDNVNSLVSF